MDNGTVEIILAIIGLLSAILTGVLVPYYRSKTTEKQRDNIYTIVRLAVQSAEQIFFQAGSGERKKEYVLTYLNNKGIKIDKEDLDIFIEAAVKELNLIQEGLIYSYISINYKYKCLRNDCVRSLNSYISTL